MTVDAHVHLLPPRLGAAIRHFFAEAGIAPEAWKYPLDHHKAVGCLAAEGVTQAWSLPYARRPGTAGALNRSSAAIAAQLRSGPVDIVPGATVHPGDNDPAAIVRAGVEDDGLRVLKLHCSVGDYQPDDPRLDPVWDYASEIRLPVVVHAGHAVSGHTSAAEIVPIATVAGRWPDARVIVAHCGFGAVEEVLDVVTAHTNVYADLTPVVRDPVTLPPDRVEALARRLLFGSDCPNTIVTVTEGLDNLDRMVTTDAARGAIVEGNARRLQAEIRT